jgi:4-hydroxy-3-methylbut-2-en-1-yl diphosphate reductase
MKIILADHYGLCFGVRDAIAQAERLANQEPLTILGELAHNPLVGERLAAAGVRQGSLEAVGGAATARVMITAHGASESARTSWRKAGFTVIDGACPLVRQAHEQLRKLVAAGCFPVVIGKRGHVEVNGLTGDFPEAFVFEDFADLPNLPVHERYGVVSQTTQPIEKVAALVESMARLRPTSEVRFSDTVCKPTKDRQTALRKLLAEADTIVVVGGRNSNNTLQLVAAAAVAGRQVFHVERADELESEWFRETDTVGVTAGTSTLKETVAAVAERLREFAEKTAASGNGNQPRTLHSEQITRL